MNIISSILFEDYVDYFNVLGANIRCLRESAKLTQEQLADLCDLHRTYVGAIERGDRNVSLRNIVKIAAALKTTPSKLLEISES